MIEFQAGDGTTAGYLALPPAGNGPGVLVLHAWWGLNETFRGVCDRLAQAGFVALAPDLYHGKTAETPSDAEQLAEALSFSQASADIDGALAALRAHPAVRAGALGCVGFSLGAALALAAAPRAPDELRAVVLFYGTAAGPDYARAKAAFLGHFAEHDPWEPAEGVVELEQALRAAGREVTFYTYPGVGHWFFEENRPDAYNAEAALLAWERTEAFLRGHLGEPEASAEFTA